MSDSLNIAGLIFDIIGVLILFIYALPSAIIDGGGIMLETTPEQDKAITKQNKKVKFLAYLGMALVVLGFLLQIFASGINLVGK